MYKKVVYDRRHDKYKERRNAAVYDAYISLSGKTGRSANYVITHIAGKLGVSRQRVQQIIKTEREGRDGGDL